MTAPMTPTDTPSQPEEMIVEVIEVLDPTQAGAHDTTTPGGEPVEVIEVIVIEPDADTSHDPTATADPTAAPDPTTDPTTHDPSGATPAGTADPSGTTHDPTGVADPTGAGHDPSGAGPEPTTHDVPAHEETHDDYSA